MTGCSPSGQNQQTPLYGYPHFPYTFVPGYLRFQPACRPAPAYASVPAAATFPHHSVCPQPHSHMQAIQRGQEGPPEEKSREVFYTLPKRTPVKISKPEEPSLSQAMELPPASSHTTSDMNTASVDKGCHTVTNAIVGILQEPKQHTRSSKLNPLAHLFAPLSMGTSESVSNMPTTTTIRPQSHIYNSGQVLPCSNPVLSSSVFLSSPEMIPTMMSSASTPPESDFSHKIKAESVDRNNGLITFDSTEHQPGATEATTVQQPGAFPKDQDQDSGLEKISETDHEPFLLRAPIGDGFWAVLALYVERDLEAAQSRFSDLEGRLISDYRDHTLLELGELVAETVKDEKEEMMD